MKDTRLVLVMLSIHFNEEIGLPLWPERDGDIARYRIVRLPLKCTLRDVYTPVKCGCTFEHQQKETGVNLP